MKFDKEHWKELDINVESLWLIGPRAKGGKRENIYHGNFVPQIPDNLIRRYTEEKDIVVDLFLGSGTSLFESERLGRDFIGFDINDEILDYVQSKMDIESPVRYFINHCDVTDTVAVSEILEKQLKILGKKKYDFLLLHPPYWDIVKFTDKENDLSKSQPLDSFVEKFIIAVKNAMRFLKANKYAALVVGDIYRESQVVPLGFYLMNAIMTHCDVKLKGIVVKDMVGNRAKLGSENLWKYKALKSDFFLFKHEYIFVFKHCRNSLIRTV